MVRKDVIDAVKIQSLGRTPCGWVTVFFIGWERHPDRHPGRSLFPGEGEEGKGEGEPFRGGVSRAFPVVEKYQRALQALLAGKEDAPSVTKIGIKRDPFLEGFLEEELAELSKGNSSEELPLVTNEELLSENPVSADLDSENQPPFSNEKIESFLAGELSFDEVLDDYTKIYAEVSNSNQYWSWDDIIYGGEFLSRKQRAAIKNHAVSSGAIPDVKVIEHDDMRYGVADFESAGLVVHTCILPEDLWHKSNVAQFQWLNEQIGGAVPGYTWHHTETPGVMQLVPFGIHNITTHNGGRTYGQWVYIQR